MVERFALTHQPPALRVQNCEQFFRTNRFFRTTFIKGCSRRHTTVGNVACELARNVLQVAAHTPGLILTLDDLPHGKARTSNTVVDLKPATWMAVELAEDATTGSRIAPAANAPLQALAAFRLERGGVKVAFGVSHHFKVGLG